MSFMVPVLLPENGDPCLFGCLAHRPIECGEGQTLPYGKIDIRRVVGREVIASRSFRSFANYFQRRGGFGLDGQP